MARSEHHPSGLIHYNPELSFRGYTLFTANHTQAILIDMHGRVVHRWEQSRGITNAELLLQVLLVADGYDEAPLSIFRLSLHEQVEPEVVVGSIVRYVAPDPGATLDRLDLPLPANAWDGLP